MSGQSSAARTVLTSQVMPRMDGFWECSKLIRPPHSSTHALGCFTCAELPLHHRHSRDSDAPAGDAMHGRFLGIQHDWAGSGPQHQAYGHGALMQSEAGPWPISGASAQGDLYARPANARRFFSESEKYMPQVRHAKKSSLIANIPPLQVQLLMNTLSAGTTSVMPKRTDCVCLLF